MKTKNNKMMQLQQLEWGWAIDGITDIVPRTSGPECMNYMTNRRRCIEAVIVSVICIYYLRWAVKRLEPIVVPSDIETTPSYFKLLLIVSMTFVFGMEMGFKFAEKTVIFTLNPCHIQTIMQIYLLAAKPTKANIALFRIQMNYLNGPFLAFLFPEVETRSLNLEQFTYWTQHALLYIIPAYLIRSGSYRMENLKDYNWTIIGVTIMLLYHFIILGSFSVLSGINLNHMLCAALSDPFQGQQYRLAACVHESILCPFLNKLTTILFTDYKNIKMDVIGEKYDSENNYRNYNSKNFVKTFSAAGLAAATTTTTSLEEQLLTTKKD